MSALYYTPIGKEKLEKILRKADHYLMNTYHVDVSSLPQDGTFPVYRLNDFGMYVTEETWDRYWKKQPQYHEMAWMLSDNGQYSAEDVAEMSIIQIREAYKSPDFDPEFAYYTEY